MQAGRWRANGYLDPIGPGRHAPDTLDARDVALNVLRRVFTQGAFASTVLRHELGSAPKARPSVGTGRTPTGTDVEGAERGLATEIVYGVLRRRAFLDRAVSRAAGRRMKDLDPKLHDVLRVAAYQLLYLDRIPDHAAVNAAVDQAKRRLGKRGASATNAILRKLSERPRSERIPPPVLTRDPSERVAHQGGLPRALAELLVQDLGPDVALAYAEASLHPAPLTLRANLLRTTRQALCAEVKGTPGESLRSVRLAEGGHVLPADLPCVVEGRATPQDEASMRVVELLDPRPDERILDVCSAPGGKTTCIAEATEDQARVVAYDRLPNRLARVAESAARLGLSSIQTVEVLPEPEAAFDRVLVDAPCSGLGTLRRHPELRWKFRADDLEGLARTQRQILAEGAKRLKPGGILVYSVCTVTGAEGPDVIETLRDTFELEHTLQTGPHQPGAPDGFFAARLKKR